MILDPESFVPAEVDRRLAPALSRRRAAGRIPRRRARRGVTVRLAAWASGRTALL